MGSFRKILGGGLIVGGIMAARAAIRAARTISLENRIVLITGGSRGLGLIMARQVADEGGRVVICARNQEELSRASDILSRHTSDFLAVSCDISDRQQVKSMIGEIKTKMGEVDILINNAGIIQVGPMESMTEEDYENAMKVHFWGPFYVINEVIPAMIKNEFGRIVNIISINGKITFPHLLPYTVSKYALAGFSEGSGVELAHRNIRVTSVYPGLMRTGSPRNIDVKGQHQKEYAWFKISGSLPGFSMNAEEAAGKIIRAMKAGDKILTIGLPAKFAIALQGLLPELQLSIFDLANKILPNIEGSGTVSKKGYESSSKLSSSAITKKTDEAAMENNEM